jgi:hypothetical protein
MPLKGLSITITYTAWNTSTNIGQTGDVANHTLRIIKDGTAAAPTNTPTEVDATNCPGEYKLTLTTTETTADTVKLAGKSSTANVVIIPVSLVTEHGSLPQTPFNTNGGLPVVDSNLALKVGSYATGQDPATYILTTPANKLATDASGRVTVAGYASGQDPATLVWAAATRSLTDKANFTLATNAVDAAQFTQAAADKIWSSTTRTLSAFGFNVTVGGYVAGQDAATYVLNSPANKLVTDSSGRVILQSLDSPSLHNGTSTAGSSTTITLQNTANSTNNDIYKGCLIKIYGGTGAGQTRLISAYTASTFVATVSRAWVVNPDATSLYSIIAQQAPLLDAALQVTVGSYASGQDPATLVWAAATRSLTDKANFTLASNAVDAAQFTQAAADKVWSSTTRTLSAFAFNVTVGGYAVSQDPATYILSTPANKLVTDSSGRITVGTYASGQDPGTYVLATPSIKLTTITGGYVQVDMAQTLPASPTAGTHGEALKFADTRLDAAITSRMPTGNVTVGAYAAGQDPATLVWAAATRSLTDKANFTLASNAVDAAQFTQAAADKVWTSTTRTLSAFGFSVTVSGNVTVGGYAAGQDPATLVWAATTRSLTDKANFTLANNAVDTAQFTQAAADKVWSTTTRTLTAFAFNVNVTGLTVNGDGSVNINMSQSVPFRNLTSITTLNIGDAFTAARGQGAGAWDYSTTNTGIVKNPDNTTMRTFTLNGSTPTTRT